MIGFNLLLVAWWSFAMWCVTRISRFVEGKLTSINRQPQSHLGAAEDVDEDETIHFMRGGMSGLPAHRRVYSLAGLR